MKWTQRLLPVAVVALSFWACPDGDTTDGDVPGVPENLTATATTDGLGIVLSWSPGAGPVEPESFFIYFNDSKIASVPATQTSYTVSDAGVGNYGVSAWANGNESGKSTVSTFPVETSNLQVYELNANGPSGIYVGSDLKGYSKRMCDADAPSVVDFYFTDKSSGSDVGLVYFRSAHLVTQDESGWPPCSNPPSGQWKTAYVARVQSFNGIADPGTSQETQVFSGPAEFVFKVNVGGNWHYGYFATSAPDAASQSVTLTTFKVSPIPGFKKIQ